MHYRPDPSHAAETKPAASPRALLDPTPAWIKGLVEVAKRLGRLPIMADAALQEQTTNYGSVWYIYFISPGIEFH